MAAENGINLQSLTLKFDENGKPFYIHQTEQIRLYKDAWTKAGHSPESRGFGEPFDIALMNDQDRMYFGKQRKGSDSFGYIDPKQRALFGRGYATEPGKLIWELPGD